MHWNMLTTEAQLDEIDRISRTQAVLIYKHSNRCSICTAALGRLERKWPAENRPVPYFLDVLQHRALSNSVAARYSIQHESPQVLLIRNGRCELSHSHMEIDPSQLVA
jgi:bacillithiol system protein YtxJ